MQLISTSAAAAGAAILCLLLPAGVAAVPQHVHSPVARRHGHHANHQLNKRGDCQFPTGEGLVAVTPNAMNAGWAMSPDQPCNRRGFCPYACPAGQLMAQWDPKAVSYSYPESMNGGLYCNENGEIEKPFPDKPYCYDGVGTFVAVNEAGGSVAICQTVLPGNEAMLIPTVVDSTAVLAVPDTSYWCATAAHYYINPPGVSAEEGCVWGSKDKPYGNWSPYVSGANELDSGETFVKLGWNPIYIEPDVPFRDVMPDWGVRIECDGNCGGLPCEIDPAKHGVNEVSGMTGPGAGGANFCVVGVPKGSTARLVIFGGSGGGGGGDSGDKDKDEDKDKEEEKPDEVEEVGAEREPLRPDPTQALGPKLTPKKPAPKAPEPTPEEEKEPTTSSPKPHQTSKPFQPPMAGSNNNRIGGILLVNNTSSSPDTPQETSSGTGDSGGSPLESAPPAQETPEGAGSFVRSSAVGLVLSGLVGAFLTAI